MKKIQITQEMMNELLTNKEVTHIEGLSGNSFLYYYKLFKVDLYEHFYIIYMARRWFDEGKVFIPNKIEVCGYIKKSNNHLFSPNYYLRDILNSIKQIPCIQYTDFYDLKFNDILSKELTQEIKNRWDDLKNEKYKDYFSDIEYIKNHSSKDKAIKWVCEDNLYSPPEYQYNIEVNMEDEDYIEYLSNSENYIKNKINQFMNDKNKLSSFFESIIIYEYAVRHMSDILNNPDFQHTRNMKNALKDLESKYENSIKTVTIKVIKNNIEWYGKININNLKCCHTYEWISIWECAKKDRDNFEQLFGNDDLYPEDIEEIIFRNKIIYKKGEEKNVG